MERMLGWNWTNQCELVFFNIGRYKLCGYVEVCSWIYFLESTILQ